MLLSSGFYKENRIASFTLMNRSTHLMNDPKFIAFELSSGMEIQSWLAYSDDICSNEKKYFSFSPLDIWTEQFKK